MSVELKYGDEVARSPETADRLTSHLAIFDKVLDKVSDKGR